MTNDDFTGIFDLLTPDDFKESHGVNRGAEAFADWVRLQLDGVRTLWAETNGHLNPVTVIADSKTSMTMPAIAPETLGQYKIRVRDQARRLGATWLFTARKTDVGSYPTTTDDPDLPDTTPDAATAEAIAAKYGISLSEGIYYFAARHEGDELERKHGMIASENGRLGETVEGDPDVQSISFYGDILS